jgi:hypothetical protein
MNSGIFEYGRNLLNPLIDVFTIFAIEFWKVGGFELRLVGSRTVVGGCMRGFSQWCISLKSSMSLFSTRGRRGALSYPSLKLRNNVVQSFNLSRCGQTWSGQTEGFKLRRDSVDSCLPR